MAVHVQYMSVVLTTFPFYIVSVLLNYLAQNWDKVGSKLDKKLFQNTLRSFAITNEELASQGRNSIEGYTECVAACKVGMRVYKSFFTSRNHL